MGDMRIRRVIIKRFRGIEHLEFKPGPSTVILGPNNAGKSTVLEGLDLLLHPGLGRPRPDPEEVDYFQRDPSEGFEIEAVLGDMSDDFRAEVHPHLEGWRSEEAAVVAEPDGQDIEPIVRVRVRATPDFDVIHEFAKPESEGVGFHRRLRSAVGWVFDGRTRDPGRQLFFYQGGLLDQLFADADTDPAIHALREGLGHGAEAFNSDAAVNNVLKDLSSELANLGLLGNEELAAFEPGAVSRRALLQTLRLALPASGDVLVPLVRQGRGTQRLVLVTVLLRLSAATGLTPIGAFEEPEEALEPLRQAHLAEMFLEMVERGGQVFVVTHSPEIARRFDIEDFLLLQERTAGKGAQHLSGTLSAPVRQAYERRVDGAVVRGLFCRIPLIVEGPGDRAVFDVFWRRLAATEDVLPAFRLGLDVVNAEGAPNMPMLAAVLNEAGKSAVAWVEQDTPEVLREITRLKDEKNCAALLLHDPAPGRQNLEQALAWGSPIDALSRAMEAIALDRNYSWAEQREDLLSRCDGVDADRRERAKAAGSLAGFLAQLNEPEARQLVAAALAARGVTPFEMKGARQARLLAETIIEEAGVPDAFAHAFQELDAWIRDGCARDTEIQMVAGV